VYLKSTRLTHNKYKLWIKAESGL